MKKGKILIDVNDIVSKRFGKLYVECYAGYNYSNTLGGMRMRHYYVCECDCGCTSVVQRGPLLNEITRSCGCSRRGRKWQSK